jgi:hypothetical protein
MEEAFHHVAEIIASLVEIAAYSSWRQVAEKPSCGCWVSCSGAT